MYMLVQKISTNFIPCFSYLSRFYSLFNSLLYQFAIRIQATSQIKALKHSSNIFVCLNNMLNNLLCRTFRNRAGFLCDSLYQ